MPTQLPPIPQGYTLDEGLPSNPSSAGNPSGTPSGFERTTRKLPPIPAGYTLDVSGSGGSNAPVPSTLDSVMTGVNKGAMKTVYNLGDLIRRGEHGVVGMLPQDVQDYLNSAPDSVKNFIGYGDQRPLQDPSLRADLTPSNTPEKLGYGAETVAENLPAVGALLRGGAAIGRGAVALGDRALGPATVNKIAKGIGYGAGGYTGHAVGLPGVLGGGAVGSAVAGKLLNMARAAQTPAELLGVTDAAPAVGEASEAGAVATAPRPAADVVEAILPPETVPTTGNPYQAANRITKTNKMARFLHQNGEGLTTEEASRMSDADWKFAEQGAGVKPLSKASRQATLQWLQQYENYANFQRARWAAQDAATQAASPIAPAPTPEGLK